MKKPELTLGLVTTGYPSHRRSHEGVFVREQVDALTRAGAAVQVVAPWSLNRGTRPRELTGRSSICRPYYLSASARNLGRRSTFPLSVDAFARSAWRGIRPFRASLTHVYGHFLYPAGYAALRVASALDLPAVAALGESDLSFYQRHLSSSRIREDVDRFSGFLAVSERNRRWMLEEAGVPDHKVLVEPNGVDLSRFRPDDRVSAKRSLGLSGDDTLVVFVGHLTERKGPLRLAAALEPIGNARVAYLGTGPQRPPTDCAVHVGAVPHSEVIRWLQAADVFALPTLAEGSCNAVLEAMACGVPIISSDLDFNRDVLDPSFAILVDPMDVGELSDALRQMLTDPDRRAAMSVRARARAEDFSVEARAARVVTWLADL